MYIKKSLQLLLVIKIWQITFVIFWEHEYSKWEPYFKSSGLLSPRLIQYFAPHHISFCLKPRLNTCCYSLEKISNMRIIKDSKQVQPIAKCNTIFLQIYNKLFKHSSYIFTKLWKLLSTRYTTLQYNRIILPPPRLLTLNSCDKEKYVTR